jgi:hypothetical protein
MAANSGKRPKGFYLAYLEKLSRRRAGPADDEYWNERRRQETLKQKQRPASKLAA